MTRQNWLIVLFGLAVLTYGLSQYWDQQRSPVFEVALLDFLPNDIQTITVDPEGEVPYRLLRRQGRWLLTTDKINEPANEEMVKLVLNRLRSIRTIEIVTHDPTDLEEYGLQTGAGTLICLEDVEEKQQCIQLGTYRVAKEKQKFLIHARLPGRNEVYTFDGLRMNFFTGKIDVFRHQQLSRVGEEVTQLEWITAADTFMAVKQGNTWAFSPNMIAPDSMRWLAYVEKIKQLEAPSAANDFDELSLDSQLVWNLQLHTLADVIRLRAFQDSLRVPAYLLHSSQFPQRWLTADSAFVEQLAWPW